MITIMLISGMVGISLITGIMVIQVSQMSSQYKVVKFWSYFYPRKHMVRLIDYQNKIYHTLVEPGPNHTLVGHLYWSIKVGEISLLPNGVVDPNSDCSYVYGWEHVDPDLKLQQQLSWPNHKSLDVWQGLDHQEKWQLRHAD